MCRVFINHNQFPEIHLCLCYVEYIKFIKLNKVCFFPNILGRWQGKSIRPYLYNSAYYEFLNVAH